MTGNATDFPSLEVFLASQLSRRDLNMVEDGIKLVDVLESVSHTAR